MTKTKKLRISSVFFIQAGPQTTMAHLLEDDTPSLKAHASWIIINDKIMIRHAI